jgi:hypothetical protein
VAISRTRVALAEDDVLLLEGRTAPSVYLPCERPVAPGPAAQRSSGNFLRPLPRPLSGAAVHAGLPGGTISEPARMPAPGPEDLRCGNVDLPELGMKRSDLVLSPYRELNQ